MTTEMQPPSVNPADLVRPLHALLAHQLGLRSPLDKAVKMLDRASATTFSRTSGVATARAERAFLARSIALGEREFDDASVREFDLGAVWVTLDAYDTPAAVSLSDAVRIEAHRAAGGELLMHAAKIFDQLAAEAAKVVEQITTLPEAPARLFGAGDPTTLLTRAAHHGETYSRLLAANDRFWQVTGAADLVRGPAGYGVERFPAGAPRLAGTYRNWRLALEKADSDLRSVHKHFRLWFTVTDGWEPGVWRPEDIETAASDRSFSTLLKRFGGAVGIPSGGPAA